MYIVCACTYTHLPCHDALFIIFSKMSDEVKQFISLFLPCPYPALLEATKQMIKLFRREIPSKFDQKVMNVFNNGFMLAVLTRPYSIKVIQRQYLLFDAKSHQSVKFFNILQNKVQQGRACEIHTFCTKANALITLSNSTQNIVRVLYLVTHLWLVKIVSENNSKDIVISNPLCNLFSAKLVALRYGAEVRMIGHGWEDFVDLRVQTCTALVVNKGLHVW